MDNIELIVTMPIVKEPEIIYPLGWDKDGQAKRRERRKNRVKAKPDYALKVKLGDSTKKKVNETRRKCRLNFLNLKREQVRAAMKEAGYSEDEIKTALHHNHKSLKIGYDAGMQCADQNPL